MRGEYMSHMVRRLEFVVYYGGRIGRWWDFLAGLLGFGSAWRVHHLNCATFGILNVLQWNHKGTIDCLAGSYGFHNGDL